MGQAMASIPAPDTLMISPAAWERFRAKVCVAESGCWEWIGARNGGSRGPRYGNFVFKGTVHKAHRVAWEIYRGQIPVGVEVCHRCDNEKCVNPDHLFLGTHQDNMDDMMRKGRGNRDGKASRKVTDDQVREIRLRAAAGVTAAEMARELGMSKSGVCRIVRGESFPEVN